MSQYEFELLCVQNNFRRMRDRVSSGMDMWSEVRLEDVREGPYHRICLRQNVAALEGVLDQLQKELDDTRKELAGIEDAARLEEVDLVREKREEMAREMREAEKDTDRERGFVRRFP